MASKPANYKEEMREKAYFNSHIVRKYGITKEEYLAKLEAQDGKCAICRQPPEVGNAKQRLHVDHNHESGEVRGLLCFACNSGIGQFKESLQLLNLAANYIGRYSDMT